MTTPFGEVAVLDDGRRVVAPWRASGLYVGDRHFSGPEIRMPDAVLTPSGRVWVCGVDQHTSAVWLWTEDVWRNIGRAFASRAIVRADGDSGCRVAFADTASTWREVAYVFGHGINERRGTIPDGAGATGMRCWGAGQPLPLTPLDQVLNGYLVRAEVYAGTTPTLIAASLGMLPDQVVMRHAHDVVGTLYVGPVDWPSLRLSANGKFWASVHYTGQTIVGGPVPAVTPPLVTFPPVEPPPVPPTAKATIKSFETPIVWGKTSRAVAEATSGTPEQYRWEYFDGGVWKVAATNPASDTDHHFAFTRAGSYDIRLVTLVGGKQTDVTSTRRTIVQLPPVAPTPVPPPTPGPVTPADVWHTAGRVFIDSSGRTVRYKGVTAFKLAHLYEAGENIDGFLDDYAGFNVLRVFAYTPAADWHDQAWGVPTVDDVRQFCAYVGSHGFQVELTLLTDDDPAKLEWAKGFVPQLSEIGGRPFNLLLEAGNEPTTHKSINTAALKSVLDASGFLYASGNYEDATKMFGRYGTSHGSRDTEWVRRGHDLLEYYNGGGPNAPSDPAHHIPQVGDEPAKTEDVGPPAPPLTKADDWRAYFGTCALLGAGATFHSQTGKFGQRPTQDERVLAAAALEGLNAFPPDAPLGGYSRPVENSLRTYVVGNSMVRVRPSSSSPGPGWVRVGASNVLWRRS